MEKDINIDRQICSHKHMKITTHHNGDVGVCADCGFIKEYGESNLTIRQLNLSRKKLIKENTTNEDDKDKDPLEDAQLLKLLNLYIQNKNNNEIQQAFGYDNHQALSGFRNALFVRLGLGQISHAKIIGTINRCVEKGLLDIETPEQITYTVPLHKSILDRVKSGESIDDICGSKTKQGRKIKEMFGMPALESIGAANEFAAAAILTKMEMEKREREKSN